MQGADQVYGGGSASRDAAGAVTDAIAAGSYSGAWALRGSGGTIGLNGPRAVVVDPWGASSSVSLFETSESYAMGTWTWQDPIGAVGARQAYGLGLDGSGVIVAVADGLIDTGHFDLSGQLIGSSDASSGTGTLGTGDNHGTHVAGIIAADANGSGMHGVAPGADLYGISFGSTPNGYLDIDLDNFATAIGDATTAGARIFNNSWGSAYTANTYDSALDDNQLRSAMADAIDKGAVFIWAAGNDFSFNTNLGAMNTSQEAKAALKYQELAGGFINVVNLAYDTSAGEWVISNELSELSFFEEADTQICGVTKDYCLAAPGTQIYSTIPGGGGFGTYDNYSGTSMAAPMVSGGLAILFQAFPYVETADILELLFTTADDLGAVGVDEVYGHGMMNLAAALQPSGSAAIPTTASLSTNTGISASDSLLLADASLAAALSTATEDLIMLDSFDRAFVLGSAGIQAVPAYETSSATSLAADMRADFETLASFGLPVNEGVAQTGALAVLGDEVSLGLDSQLHVSTIAKAEGGSAQAQYISATEVGNWQVSRSVGILHEEGQLFGNQGSGAYALADQATTASFGANAQRDLPGGLTLFGGVSVNETMVGTAEDSLIDMSSTITSASALMGLRLDGLGRGQAGTFAIQLGQERHVLEGVGVIQVPVGRDEGGVILVEEHVLSEEDLSLLPELKISYHQPLSLEASYAVSAAASEVETTLAADWQRAF